MKALALVEAPDHVCCRYRIRAFGPALEAAGWALTVEGLARNPLERICQLRRAGRYDAALLQRKLLPGWQLHLLRRSARRLLFDFDDAVLYRDSYDPRGPDCPRRARRFARTVRLADGILAGNDFLADCARAHGARGGRVHVIPTCIEADRYAPKAADRAADRQGPVDLVWIGSSSTLRGLERRRGLLERLGRTVPGLRLRVICDRFPEFRDLAVVPVPWSEPEEARAIAAGDIGISLVPDDLWSRGKCGLKVLQYRAAGLPVVADPVGVHPRIIRDGVDGLLAGSDDAWVAAVHRLATDPALRTRMGQAARRALVAEYSVDAWSGRFVAALAGTTPVPPPKALLRSGRGHPASGAAPGDLSLCIPGVAFRRTSRWL